MELKRLMDYDAYYKYQSSNRTFMELKPSSNNRIKAWARGSNHTFMELKLLGAGQLHTALRVLIVPLWN